jgi:hypothetical protein
MKYIIYKISIADYTYIGSTRDWKQRQSMHKSCFFNENSRIHNLKLYQIIRENGGWDAIEKNPIEEYECEGPTQARIREEYWRREYDAQMNTRRAHRTREEYIQSDRDKANTYYANNREAIKQIWGEKIQCECGATITRGNKSTHNKTKKHADLLAAQQNINV